MSMRTIVELNHDMAFKVERDKEAFIAALMRLFNGGSEARGVREEMHRFGVTISETCHHSTRREVIIGGGSTHTF